MFRFAWAASVGNCECVGMVCFLVYGFNDFFEQASCRRGIAPVADVESWNYGASQMFTDIDFSDLSSKAMRATSCECFAAVVTLDGLHTCNVEPSFIISDSHFCRNWAGSSRR